PADRLFCMALCLPVLAVLSNQVFTGQFEDSPYDAPARMLLAVAAFWWLSRCRSQDLRFFQWGLCAGAVTGLTTLLFFSVPGIAPRPLPPLASAVPFGHLALLLGVCSCIASGRRITDSVLDGWLKVICGFGALYASCLSQARGGWLALPVRLASLILGSRQS